MLKVAYFLRKLQTLRVHNLRILMIKNVKFSGYCFYTNPNIEEDFQICISVPLNTTIAVAKMGLKKVYCKKHIMG